MKKQNITQNSAVQSPDSLQLKTARVLVNSDKWSEKLDPLLGRYIHIYQWSPSCWRPSIDNQFFEKWSSIRSMAVISNIEWQVKRLLGRTPSENEYENITTA